LWTWAASTSAATSKNLLTAQVSALLSVRWAVPSLAQVEVVVSPVQYLQPEEVAQFPVLARAVAL
jgi:hypothetical protein